MKKIPLEVLIDLNQKLVSLRDPSDAHLRRSYIQKVAKQFSVSESSVYRYIKSLGLQHKDRKIRSDKGKPTVLSNEKLFYYCQYIAALKVASVNDKGHMLSTEHCIELLESGNVLHKDKSIQVEKGLLKKSTINRYLDKYYIKPDDIFAEPTVNHFESQYSNQCWQLDITPSEIYRFPSQQANDPRRVMTYSVLDDRSGIAFSKYYLAEGEDALTVLDFLYCAFSKITNLPNELYGIPDFIYTDNARFVESALFRRVMKKMGIKILSHLPRGKSGRKTTARSKGKVERHHRTIKSGIEPTFKINVPQDIDEANNILASFINDQNTKQHRRLSNSRINVWHASVVEGSDFSVCPEDHYRSLLREPFDRVVKNDATVQVNNVIYQLSAQFSGEKVIVLLCSNESEIYIEHRDEEFGPFYPAILPAEFGEYYNQSKSKKESTADNVVSLIDSISLKKEEMKSVYKRPSNINPHKLYHKTKYYKSKIEARMAVSTYIGKPLSELLPEQVSFIHKITESTLSHSEIMQSIDQFFEMKLIQNKGTSS